MIWKSDESEKQTWKLDHIWFNCSLHIFLRLHSSIDVKKYEKLTIEGENEVENYETKISILNIIFVFYFNRKKNKK